MTKKHFIALADYIRDAEADNEPFTPKQIERLADFCEFQNLLFNRERWLGYIKGECGSDGGKIKP
jgi:hypothetical protein